MALVISLRHSKFFQNNEIPDIVVQMFVGISIRRNSVYIHIKEVRLDGEIDESRLFAHFPESRPGQIRVPVDMSTGLQPFSEFPVVQ